MIGILLTRLPVNDMVMSCFMMRKSEVHLASDVGPFVAVSADHPRLIDSNLALSDRRMRDQRLKPRLPRGEFLDTAGEGRLAIEEVLDCLVDAGATGGGWAGRLPISFYVAPRPAPRALLVERHTAVRQRLLITHGTCPSACHGSW